MSLCSKFIRFLSPIAASVALLWACLINREILAFRDAMHFYYPLWDFLDRSSLDYWLLPHFNYLDRVGVPLIAEPTTMTFYPGRFLLRLPLISLEQSNAVFIVFHLALAWFGTYLSLRRVFRRSTLASSIAASAYTFGGFTYFQIYNAPYLVSSAWLPYALGAITAISKVQDPLAKSTQTRIPKHSTKRWQMLLLLSLMAMCLGGDFQLPYNLGLIAAAVCVVNGIKNWRRSSLIAADSLKGFKRNSFALVVCFGLAAFCTAIQSIPTYCWMSLGSTSEKIAHRGVSNRYTFEAEDLLTYITPTCLGSYAPNHTRWASGLMTDSMWVASIHNGVLATAAIFVLGLGFKFRRTRLLGWLVLTSVILAAGDSLGMYWVLKSVAPLYDGFRYPMKWFAIAAYGLSGVTAFGIDACLRNSRIRARVVLSLWILSAFNLSVVVFITACSVLLPEWLSFLSNRVPSDRLCGGFDSQACLNLISTSAFAAALAAGIVAMLLRSRWKFRATAIEVTALLHLLICSCLTTSTIDPSAVKSTAEPDARWLVGDEPIPIHWNSDYLGNPSDSQAKLHEDFVDQPQSAAEVARYQKRLVVGKLHLLDNARSVSAQLSLEPIVYEHGPQLSWLQERVSPQLDSSSLQISLESNKIDIELQQQDSPVEITLPILQDGGWSCDAPEVAIDFTDNQLLRLRLPPKVEHVTLTYFTPGLKLGAFVTFLSLILAVVYFQRSHV